MKFPLLQWPWVALVVGGLSLIGCTSDPEPSASTPAAAQWPSDCAPLSRPAPLTLEDGREAHRWAERIHEKRLREAASPGAFLRALHEELVPSEIAGGRVCLSHLVDAGRMLFEHEYGFADGLGRGDAARSPQGPFRRVHGDGVGGPETISCTSCHWVGGPNGAGSEVDNAILAGDGRSVASGDARNPQALMGLGVVLALAREMTEELQAQRSRLVAEGLDEIALASKGVSFGRLRLVDGRVDATGVVGVDEDLVVRPFGWKGNFVDIRDFATDALQVHFSVQSEALVEGDADGDGIERELGNGPLAALLAHLATLEMPVVEPLVQRDDLGPAAAALLAPTTTNFSADFATGRKLFHEVGCTGCHTPMMVLQDPVLALDGMPPIDLSQHMRRPGLVFDSQLGGYPVWLFSDLKRHDMGARNAARHVQRGVDLPHYMTPRLWGGADSAPYLHDGRAPNFDYAIAGHDGEAQAARDAYAALSREQQSGVRVYLMSMRRAPRFVVP